MLRPLQQQLKAVSSFRVRLTTQELWMPSYQPANPHARHWRVRRHGGLKSLLRTYSVSGCGDPHDHVYDLLDLSKDAKAFSIDYACSMITILAEAAVFCSQTKDKLYEDVVDPTEGNSDSMGVWSCQKLQRSDTCGERKPDIGNAGLNQGRSLHGLTSKMSLGHRNERRNWECDQSVIRCRSLSLIGSGHS